MRLVTRCPACSTTFKVVRDQLRISDGWVRCGRCSEVFDATQDLWEANDDGTPSAQVVSSPLAVPAPVPAAAPAVEPPQSTLPPFEDELHEDEPFDLGPDPPSAVTSRASAPLPSWPSPDLLDLSNKRSSSAGASASVIGQGASIPLDEGFSTRSGLAGHEPSFDALPSFDAGVRAYPGADAQRREPAFSPQLTAPSPVVSPIEEAVNAQLKKALRRERVKALRQERAEKRERERTGAIAGDPPLGESSATPAPAIDPSPSSEATFQARSTAGSSPLGEGDANVGVRRDEIAPVPHSDTAEPIADTAPLPSFVGAADASPRRRGATWFWVLACLVGLALLVVQYLRHERDLLAAREPALRPALQTLCEWTHCSLSPPRSIADISIDGASFSRESEGYRLDFTLRNRARVPLAMPAVELTLLDTQERALLRRVLLPAEYGAPGVLSAGGERSASLPLRLAGPDAAGLPQVAGYRLVAFYP